MLLLGYCAPASHMLLALSPGREQQQAHLFTKWVSQEAEKSQSSMHGPVMGATEREGDLNEGLESLEPLENPHLPI